MIRLQQLIDAVCGVLSAHWPGRLVMVEKLSQDFQRPSFSVEHLKTSGTPAGFRLWRWRHELAVCVYAPVDERGEWDRLALAGEWSELAELFTGGVLEVGDRKLEVIALPGEAGAGASALMLSFDYFDEASFAPEAGETSGELALAVTGAFGNDAVGGAVLATATEEE